MYTLEQLQQKNLNELREIGWQLNVLPKGDRRCRRNWIKVLIGVEPPLLEVSPVAQVEPVAEPIAQTSENSPGVSAEIGAYFSDDRPPNRDTGDRGRLENESKLSQSAIDFAAKNSPGVDRNSIAHQLLERLKPSSHIEDSPTLSDSFLTRYSPPKSENIHYKCNSDGQLSLLDFEVESVPEAPDPDDFDSIEDFKDALALWDAKNPESPAVSMDSMREWAPIPEDWYEPAAENSPLKAPSMNEVLELSPTTEITETSSTCNFSIFTFDAWCDRPHDKDEPPDEGSFARLPKPKPPSSPPMSVATGDGVPPRKLRTNGIKKFARSAILSGGRSPPGGDA